MASSNNANKGFEIFYEIGNLSNSKIIDLGCGTADLKKF